MSNEELIEVLKAHIDTSDPSGIASAQDAEEFIDLAVEQTQVLGMIRVETGIRSAFNLDNMALGEPVTVKATEGTAPDPADVVAVTRTRKALTPQEVIAAFDVTFSFLRKNIERGRVNETLNRIFAKRFGKDIVLMAFMGDTSNIGSTRTDKALKAIDGFVTQASTDPAVHSYTIPASPNYSTTVFPSMLGLLPKDYRDQREDLAFFVSADVYDAYAAEIGSRATALGDMLLAGPWSQNLSFMGVKLIPVFGLDTGNILLTLKENLVVGFGQELTVGRDIDNRERLLKVTLTAEVDAKYVVGDALVIGTV